MYTNFFEASNPTLLNGENGLMNLETRPRGRARDRERERSKDCLFPVYNITTEGPFFDLEEVMVAILHDSGCRDVEERKKDRRRRRSVSPPTSDEEREREREDEDSRHLMSRNAFLTGHSHTPDDLRRTQRELELPRTVVLGTGFYGIPFSFETTRFPINLTSEAPTGFPDVVLRGRITVDGPRSYSGIRFSNVRYISRASHKFYNCVFEERFSLQHSNGKLLIDSCVFNLEESNRTLISLLGGEGEFIRCTFRVTRRLNDCVALFHLASTSNCATIIRGCVFEIDLEEGTLDNLRRFFPIEIASSQPIIYDNNIAFIDPRGNNEVVFFGSCNNRQRIRLTVSGSKFVNRSANSLLVALLGSLWGSAVADTNVNNVASLSSIYVTRCSLESVRPLFFGQDACCHRESCSGGRLCSHCNQDLTDWTQSLLITYTDILVNTPSNNIVTAAVDITVPPQTRWTLSIINSTIVLNNLNIPISITTNDDVTINLSGTVFLGQGTVPVQIPGQTPGQILQPWIRVEGASGLVTVITTGGTSTTNFGPPEIENPGGIVFRTGGVTLPNFNNGF